jgi:hypothetical protein
MRHLSLSVLLTLTGLAFGGRQAPPSAGTAAPQTPQQPPVTFKIEVNCPVRVAEARP